MRRIRIEIICQRAGSKKAREDTTKTTNLLTSLRDILNEFDNDNRLDRLEVEFHMRQQRTHQPNISQLQAVIPLYYLKFKTWTLHCHLGQNPTIVEVTSDSLLARKILVHPGLRFGNNDLLFITLNHTKLNNAKTYEDEGNDLQESFFRVLPHHLSRTKNIRIEVTPLRREYLLIRMFESRKKTIDNVVELINTYQHIKKVNVVFLVDSHRFDYLRFASCFHGFSSKWTLVVVLNEGRGKGRGREVPVDPPTQRKLKDLYNRGIEAIDIIPHLSKDSDSSTLPGRDYLTGSQLPIELILLIISFVPSSSTASLRSCN